MAGRLHCKGAPSWVPDYSQNPQTAHTKKVCIRGFIKSSFDWRSKIEVTEAFEPYCRLHTGNTSVLVVKGLLTETILSVAPIRAERSDPCPQEWEKILERPAFYIKTSSWSAASETFNDIAVGDRIALISGLAVPMIVREEGAYVRIIAPLIIGHVLPIKRSFHQVWMAHVAKRKEEWMAQQSRPASPGSELEPDPAEYLEDLLIS